jgi:cell division protein ZapA
MIPVSVHILDKEYQVACAEDERDGLLHAADFVNRRMKEIRDRGNVIGTDRIAVVTALNVAHELLQLKALESSVSERVRKLQENLTAALAEQGDLAL